MRRLVGLDGSRYPYLGFSPALGPKRTDRSPTSPRKALLYNVRRAISKRTKLSEEAERVLGADAREKERGREEGQR